MSQIRNFTDKSFALLAPLLLILACASVMFAQTQPNKKAEKLSQDAYKEFYKGNYKKAIENSDKAIKAQAKSPYAYYIKGWSQFKLGQFQNALASLNTAEEQGHDPVEVSEPRGMVHYSLKDFAGAEKDLALFTLSPKTNASANFALAQTYFDQKKCDLALPKYQKAAELGFQNKDIQYYIAVCQGAQKDSEAQQKAAMQAVQSQSQFKAESYYQAGLAYLNQKKYDEAVAAFKNSIELKMLPDAFFELYKTYRLMNRDDDAMEIMKRLTREDPTNVQAFLNLSWIGSLSDKPQEAVEAARQATKLAPKESIGFTNMCRAYNDLKLFDSAVQACNDALKIKPGDGETFFYLARAKYEQKKTSEAQLYFERAAIGLVEYTKSNPDNADGFYLLGNAYYSSNQRPKAVASYLKTLDLNPRYVKARYNLGLIYTQLGDVKSARTQYDFLRTMDEPLAARLLANIEKK